MQKISKDVLVERAITLLQDGTVTSVFGWRRGEFDYDNTPSVFSSVDDIRNGNFKMPKPKLLNKNSVQTTNNVQNQHLLPVFPLSSTKLLDVYANGKE